MREGGGDGGGGREAFFHDQAVLFTFFVLVSGFDVMGVVNHCGVLGTT